MYNICIRADGSPQIGMGHIMRCLSLAKEFRKMGCTVYFLSKYKEGISKIISEDFQVIELKSERVSDKTGLFYGSSIELEKEILEINLFTKRYDIDLVIIDSYNITKDYFITLKTFINKVAYIDDINSFSYPVDFLINGNITGEYLKYIKYYEHETTLLGIEYNLIRDEFKDLPKRKVNEKINEIMITTGGSDPYNISVKLLKILLKQEKYHLLKINIIVADGFNNKQELKNISETNSNVVIYESVQSMSRIMLNCDFAISAGGSTLYELCACGTPTLAFIMAENQKFIVEKMTELGFVDSLGWYNEFSEEELLSRLEKVSMDYKSRTKVVERMQHLVDGKGASRVANVLLKEPLKVQ